MKTLARVLGGVFVLFLFAVGCQQIQPESPVLPNVDGVIYSSNSYSGSEPRLLTLPESDGVSLLGSERSSKSLVSAKLGGTVTAHYDYFSASGVLVTVKAALYVPPGALRRDTEIGLVVDQTTLAVDFSPKGTVFSYPALLNVAATGLSKENLLDGKKVSCVWYDEANGTWVKMPARSIVSNVSEGTFTCTDGVIPHFSRYAFGR